MSSEPSRLSVDSHELCTTKSTADSPSMQKYRGSKTLRMTQTQRDDIMEYWYIQSGLFCVGLAITRPGAAPGTNIPAGPMLFSIPCRAIGSSVAVKLSNVPV